MLLALVTILLGSCSRSHQLGMDDNPEEILERKLNNPYQVLTPNQSISLLNHCTQLGTQRAAHAANEETRVVFLSNTGVGKSAFLNALMGCRMKRVDPEELGIGGVEEVIIVDPESPREEVMSIGHGRQSRTFMPQIAQDPNNSDNAYCDCPGFSDNRGAEINIANAINIRSVLQQARGVKAVFLTSYDELSASRGNNIQALENMCTQMFGGEDNLIRYQNAMLLGITKAPFYTRNGEPITRNRVRSLLLGDTRIAQILANRLFLFDPLDRGHDNPDFWSLARCRNEIAQLDSIPQQEATTLFQTVLTDSDRTHLLNTIRQLSTKITNAITQNMTSDDLLRSGLLREDELKTEQISLTLSSSILDALMNPKTGNIKRRAILVGRYWQLLQRLQVIQHPAIEQLIQGTVLPAINNAILQKVDAFKDDANVHNFYNAGRTLDLLTRIKNNLPGVPLLCNINSLKEHLERCRERYAEQQARATELFKLSFEAKLLERRKEEQWTREIQRREDQRMERRRRREEEFVAGGGCIRHDSDCSIL